jgi:3',5'-cyclic-AMP phosphodiesterase
MTDRAHSIELPVNGVLTVLQLTDCHLGDTGGSTLLGVDTDASLAATVALAAAENPAAHLILATGDLANHGSSSAYERLLAHLQPLNAPIATLPGNHDDAELLARSLPASAVPPDTAICTPYWQIIRLESQIPGEVGGTLGPVQLEKLDRELADAAQASRFALVCLHHHPVPIGCEWLDQQQLTDADEFFAIIDRYPLVRGILWGHVHQALDAWRRDVRLMCTPSTCIQFAPGSVDFQLDASKPGYRWLFLLPDGRIDSGISRLVTADFAVDLNSKGYLDH